MKRVIIATILVLVVLLLVTPINSAVTARPTYPYSDPVVRMAAFRYHYVSRTATIVIAASNSSEQSQRAADLVVRGTADDEIQAALDALPETVNYKTGKIYFAEGTYQIDESIVIDNTFQQVTLEGSGKASTVWLLAKDTNMLVVDGASGVRIKNMGFYNPKRSYPYWDESEYVGHAILANRSGGIEIEGCRFWGIVGSAVIFKGPIAAPRVINCDIYFCGDPDREYAAVHYDASSGRISDITNIIDTEFGGSFWRSVSADEWVNNLTIMACYFEAVRDADDEWHPVTQVESEGERSKLTSSTFVNGGEGYDADLQGRLSIIMGCTRWCSHGDGFRVGDEGVILGCTP